MSKQISVIQCRGKLKPRSGLSEVNVGGGEVEVGEQKLGFGIGGISRGKLESGGQSVVHTLDASCAAIISTSIAALPKTPNAWHHRARERHSCLMRISRRALRCMPLLDACAVADLRFSLYLAAD